MFGEVHRSSGRTDRLARGRSAIRVPGARAILTVVLMVTVAAGCETRKVIKARPITAHPSTEMAETASLPPRESPMLDPPTDAPTCGTDGQPECPLQYWMDHHLSGPLSRQDFATLARSFRDLATAEPPGYSGWRLWADGGAAAAEQEDDIAVRRACTGCHDTYRERYRKTLRARPMQIVDP